MVRDLVSHQLFEQSWETMGVDVSFSLGSSSSTDTVTSNRRGTVDEFLDMWDGRNQHKDKLIEEVETPDGFRVEEETSTTTTTITGTVGVDLQQQRRGKQHTVNGRLILNHWVIVSYLVK